MYTEERLRQIASAFQIKESIDSIKPLGEGLINDTFKIDTKGKNYVLQHINTNIFPDVELLQHNIEAVTGHIRKKLQEKGESGIDRKVLEFIKCSDGSEKTYHRDEDGQCWRVSVFIEDSITHSSVTPEYSRCAGRAFGEFEAMLVDLKEPIGEVIPNFHCMPLRLEQLRQAVKADPVGRLRECREMVELAEQYADEMCKAERLHAQGLLPKRICHCDTKVSNVLFDRDGDVLCVIDLDTVMPSFVFSDFGDFMRTAANPVPEDSPEYDKIDFNMDIYRAFTEGYLSTAKEFLLPVEIENLPYAARLFAFMQSVRFLCDYINGDVYYKVSYPEHNYVRARNQMELFLSATEKEEEMKKITYNL